jgi:predicted porin
MKTKLMAAVAAIAVMTATGAARAQTADSTEIKTLKAQSDALKKQNQALEQRLNKLEQQQQQQAAAKPAPTSFMAADLPVLKGGPLQCAPLDLNGPLTFCGITLFGTIDAGAGWASSGLPLNGKLYLGDNLVNKSATHSYFGISPNNLSVSTIGLKGATELLPGLSGVFMASTNINPQSGQLANAPGSIIDNNGLNRNNYSNYGDGSRGGQAFNDQLYAGLASPTYGQLTFGRHRTLATDLIGAYDPAAGAAAYSLIGYSGNYGSGLGYTENPRWDDSLKYRVDVPLLGAGTVRFGAMYKFVDGNAGSNIGSSGLLCAGKNEPVEGCAASTLTTPTSYKSANDAGQIGLGGSYGGFDIDGLLGYFHQATNIGSPLSAAQNSGLSNFTDNIYLKNVALATNSYGNLNGNSLAATVADTTGGALGVKYTWNQWKFYAGWAHMIFHNPENAVGIGGQNDQGGYQLSSVNNGAYPHARLLDTVWLGTRYAYNEKTDIVAGYYHAMQNSYGFAPNTPGVLNTASTSLATCSLPGYIAFSPYKPATYNQTSPRSATCSGTLDAVSGFIDYHFTKRFDVYGGMMYSSLGGGLASGAFNASNWAPTAGARFTF